MLPNVLRFARYYIIIRPESHHCPALFPESLKSLPFGRLDWCDPGVWRFTQPLIALFHRIMPNQTRWVVKINTRISLSCYKNLSKFTSCYMDFSKLIHWIFMFLYGFFKKLKLVEWLKELNEVYGDSIQRIRCNFSNVLKANIGFQTCFMQHLTQMLHFSTFEDNKWFGRISFHWKKFGFCISRLKQFIFPLISTCHLALGARCNRPLSFSSRHFQIKSHLFEKISFRNEPKLDFPQNQAYSV